MRRKINQSFNRIIFIKESSLRISILVSNIVISPYNVSQHSLPSLTLVAKFNFELVQVSEQQLIEYFNSRVVNFKRIRGGIIFRDAIPRNLTGKLLRRNMRAWAENNCASFATNFNENFESRRRWLFCCYYVLMYSVVDKFCPVANVCFF